MLDAQGRLFGKWNVVDLGVAAVFGFMAGCGFLAAARFISRDKYEDAIFNADKRVAALSNQFDSAMKTMQRFEQEYERRSNEQVNTFSEKSEELLNRQAIQGAALLARHADLTRTTADGCAGMMRTMRDFLVKPEDQRQMDTLIRVQRLEDRLRQ